MILQNKETKAEIHITHAEPWKRPVLFISDNGLSMYQVATFRSEQAAEEFKKFIREFLDV